MHSQRIEKKVGKVHIYITTYNFNIHMALLRYCKGFMLEPEIRGKNKVTVEGSCTLNGSNLYKDRAKEEMKATMDANGDEQS